MKQRITVEQFGELTEEQKEKLREWWKPSKGDWYYYPVINHSDVISTSLIRDLESIKRDHYPLLSIGQCIEFLEDRYSEVSLGFNASGCFWSVYVGGKGAGSMIEECACERYTDNDIDNGDLVDALWQAVKATL